MRFTTLIPALLAATAYADTPDDQSDSPQAKSVPLDEPTPVGQLWTAKWDTVALQPFTQHCLNRNTYEAKVYKLANLYPDLEDFAANLKMFYNQQLYAGSWDGVDEHGLKRDLLHMSLSSLPYKVREYLKKNPSQKHFSVQEDSVFFAPGAIYPILPLWVDEPEDGGSQCDDVFDDLEAYSNEPRDGAVIGKLTHSVEGEEVVKGGKGKGAGRDVRFTVEAMVVRGKGKAPTRREKEEL